MAGGPKRGMSLAGENRTVRHEGGSVVQKIIPNSYAPVCRPIVGQLRHTGVCSMHLKATSVVAKATRQGYYWPTMHRDAREEIRKCDLCQVHALIPKLPKTLMTLIMAPWPFFQWGIDFLGPLPEALGKVKFVIVAIDCSTKWI
ncbi:reverse transcriptase domain-containing protein [Tanacetum coccineum]